MSYADSTRTVYTIYSKPKANDLQALIEGFSRAEASREQEAARRAQELRKKPRRAPKRAGRGHDPRRQVIARCRVQGHGKGRR